MSERLDDETKVLTTTFKARMHDVKQHFVGRDEIVDLLGLAVLCREHVLLVGPPGTAKSSLLDRFSTMLGAKYFTYLLTRFTEPAELFGPLDVKAFQEESRYQVNSAGMLPTAEIAFLDEIFQGSSAILNTLLSLVNERKFHNGSTVERAALLTMLGSANEIPDDPVLAAFGDRFLLRHRLDYVPDDDVDDLLEQGWSLERDLIRRDGRSADQVGPDPGRTDAVFGLNKLLRLQQAVATVDVLPVRDTFAAVVRSFRSEGITFSDRRVVKSQKIFAASALLAGRAAAEDADLAVLADMWADSKDEASIQRIVMDHGIPVSTSRGAVRVPAEIRLDLQELSVRAGQATSAPELREVATRLQRLNLEVRREHGSEAELSRQINERLRAVLTSYRDDYGQERLENV